MYFKESIYKPEPGFVLMLNSKRIAVKERFSEFVSLVIRVSHYL